MKIFTKTLLVGSALVAAGGSTTAAVYTYKAYNNPKTPTPPKTSDVNTMYDRLEAAGLGDLAYSTVHVNSLLEGGNVYASFRHEVSPADEITSIEQFVNAVQLINFKDYKDKTRFFFAPKKASVQILEHIRQGTFHWLGGNPDTNENPRQWTLDGAFDKESEADETIVFLDLLKVNEHAQLDNPYYDPTETKITSNCEDMKYVDIDVKARVYILNKTHTGSTHIINIEHREYTNDQITKTP